MSVDVDAAGHRGAHNLRRRRLADAGRMVVDQRPLEQLDLLVGQHHLGELADPRVGAVHDLVGGELVFEHGAAHADALQRPRVELDLLAATRNAHQALDCQRASIKNDGHSVSFPGGASTCVSSPVSGPNHLDHRPAECSQVNTAAGLSCGNNKSEVADASVERARSRGGRRSRRYPDARRVRRFGVGLPISRSDPRGHQEPRACPGLAGKHRTSASTEKARTSKGPFRLPRPKPVAVSRRNYRVVSPKKAVRGPGRRHQRGKLD